LIIDGVDNKKCSICNQYYPSNEEHFYINTSNKIDGLNPYCIECTKAKSSQWIDGNRTKHNENKAKSRMKNKHAHREYMKEWDKENPNYYHNYRQTHPEKIKEYRINKSHKLHEISSSEWLECKKYFGHCCAYCGKSEAKQREQNKEDFHQEHVDDDGANDLSNCIPSCTNCNSRKWKFSLFEWYNADNPIFSQENLDKIQLWLNNDYKKFLDDPIK
jgi:hypothetical protein